MHCLIGHHDDDEFHGGIDDDGDDEEEEERMVMEDKRQASCSLGTFLPIDLFPQHHTLLTTCKLISHA